MTPASATKPTYPDHPAHDYPQRSYARIRAGIAIGIQLHHGARTIVATPDPVAPAGALLGLTLGRNLLQLIGPLFAARDAKEEFVPLTDLDA